MIVWSPIVYFLHTWATFIYKISITYPKKKNFFWALLLVLCIIIFATCTSTSSDASNQMNPITFYEVICSPLIN